MTSGLCSPAPTTRVLAALAAIDGNWSVVCHAELGEPVRSAADVARQLSLNLGAVTKTLLITRRPDPGAYALAVVPVDTGVGLVTVAAVLGWSAAVLASPAELADQMAQPVGGVSPLGSALEVVVDESLVVRPRVLVGAGLRGFEIDIDPRVLVGATRARTAPILEVTCEQ
ncbi:MAG: aminoacyl-tRNA deacylase [Acidimicrobiales bacterium]